MIAYAQGADLIGAIVLLAIVAVAFVVAVARGWVDPS